jgi:hypothetical protein
MVVDMKSKNRRNEKVVPDEGAGNCGKQYGYDIQ